MGTVPLAEFNMLALWWIIFNFFIFKHCYLEISFSSGKLDWVSSIQNDEYLLEKANDYTSVMIKYP